MFFECVKVQGFWSEFRFWLEAREHRDILLSSQELIFGIFNGKANQLFRLNFLMLHAKWHIHVQKQCDKDVSLASFLRYFKNVLQIEYTIAVRHNELHVFEERFALLDL